MNPLKSCLFGSCAPESNCTQIGYTIFRVSIGISMAFGHGLGKIRDPGSFIEKVTALEFPAAPMMAWAAILGEFVGGILITLGLAARPAAALLGLTMAGAAFHVHGKHPIWALEGPSKELALLYLVACIAIMSFGSGKFGLDRFLAGKR